MERVFPIRAAAKITGLSIDLLRAWERRYQAVVPQRSNRGRQYSQADLDRLVLLKKLVERGHAIGTIGHLDIASLERLIGDSAPAVAREELTQNILQAIENYDSFAAEREVRRLAATLLPRDMVYQVILPLMRTVGDRWHDAEFHIAQEHMTSSIVRSVLGGMVRMDASEVKVILATPETELHELGILAAALILALAGFEPVYLGPNLPAEEILLAAKKTGARAILIAVTAERDILREQVNRIASGLPHNTELWIGGSASAALSSSISNPQLVTLSDFDELEAECRRFRGRV